MDSRQIRESKLPLPNREVGYSRIMFVGTTGAGKTTLLRHIIGSDHRNDRFPSTSTARTTTADIEIITVEDGPYKAAITFLSDEEVAAHVEECIQTAAQRVIEGATTERVANALLIHEEQRFRLSYILGNWPQPDDEDDFEDPEDQDEPSISEDESISPVEKSQNEEQLRILVDHITKLATAEEAQVSAEIGYSLNGVDNRHDKQRQNWWDLFDRRIAQSSMIRQVRAQILERIQDRFDKLNVGHFEYGPRNWPTVWICENEDRTEFLRDVRWFSSNHAKQFGSLLTPLVNGVRVQGKFVPRVPELRIAPRLVLIDGEGLGHKDSSIESISTNVTERLSDVDQIVLVDSATQPMVGAPLLLLRTVLDLGQITKLAVVFTHFDQVKGDNLGSQPLKIEHVRGAIDVALSSLRSQESAGQPELSRLQSQLQSNSFFLGGLDRETQSIQMGYRRSNRDDNLHALMLSMRDAALISNATGASFQLNYDGVANVLKRSAEQFRDLWEVRFEGDPASGRRKEHWTRVKALNRRLAEMGTSEYDSLRPVAELLRFIRHNLSNWLESATVWPQGTDTDESRDLVLDSLRRIISTQTHKLARDEIWTNQLDSWEKANEQAGRGSTFVRAHLMKEIFEKAAPAQGNLETLLASVKEIVEDAEQQVRAALEDNDIQES